jgi:hypothetical protein
LDLKVFNKLVGLLRFKVIRLDHACEVVLPLEVGVDLVNLRGLFLKELN